MLLCNQLIEKKWNQRTRVWYENRGYHFTKTSDIFVVKAEDLSPGSKDIVKVKCDYCGETVDVQWKDYYQKYYIGTESMYACRHCRQQKTSDNYKQQRVKSQYDKIVMMCQKNDYTLLTQLYQIDNCYSQIEYICPHHGVQRTQMYLMASGHKCIYCGYDNVAASSRLSKEEVERRFSEYGTQVINLDDYDNSMHKNMRVICPECGDVFVTSLYAFTKHGGQRCEKCSTQKSQGESKICAFLDTYRIPYITQCRFEECKDKNTLPFDFYLPTQNQIIEYDGEFHYMPICIDGKSEETAVKRLLETQRHDQIKNDFCYAHDIQIIRIPYWEYDNLNYILYQNIIY